MDLDVEPAGLSPWNLDLSEVVGLGSVLTEVTSGASVEGTGCLARGLLWRENSGLGLGVLYRFRLIWLT